MYHSIHEAEEEKMKVIHDSVHGSVRIEGGFTDLLSTPELQRLAMIKQLGLGYLVFPGANHTRLEHSLGTYHIAGLIADAVGLDEHSKKEVMAAAMLHDVGHGPFSHTLEVAFKTRKGMDHMDVTQKLITGEIRVSVEGLNGRSIPEILEEMELKPGSVASLVKKDTPDMCWPGPGKEDIEAAIIHGPIDADQLDYLMRDAHYTGVAHGTIDMERLMQTMMVRENRLVIDRSGVPAAEGILVARALMYSSVYFHRTVRIAEMMLNRGVREMDLVSDEIHMMNDCSLIEKMKTYGGFPRKMAISIIYRNLYKKALSLELPSLEQEDRKRLAEFSERIPELEREIAGRAGIDEKNVLIDIPGKDILISEPRMGETEVIVWENGLYPLSKYSTLPKALKRRNVHRWGILVATPEIHVESVKRAARYVLFG